MLQDLTSVQNLQKKHALLESDVASRQVCGIVFSASLLSSWHCSTTWQFSYFFFKLVFLYFSTVMYHFWRDKELWLCV